MQIVKPLFHRKKRTYKTNPTYPVSLSGGRVINVLDKHSRTKTALLAKSNSCLGSNNFRPGTASLKKLFLDLKK